MAPAWLAAVLPQIRDKEKAGVLEAHVNLLQAQRDDAIALLAKADRDLSETKIEIAGLKRENQEFREQIAALKPNTDLSPDAVKILGYFFDEARPFTAQEIAAQFELQPSMAQHHLDTLHRKKKYIGIYIGRGLPFGNPPLRYEIIDGGRAFIAALRGG